MDFDVNNKKRKRSVSCLFTRNSNQQGIGPVVAMALLLVVSVVAVVGFQTWFQTYSSVTFSDVELQSQSSNDLNIEGIVGNCLYIKNSGTENATILKVEIDGVDCPNAVGNYSEKIAELNITDCLASLSTSTRYIVVYTEDKILQESDYLKYVSSSSNNYGNSFVSLWNLSIDVGVSGFNNLTLPLQSDGVYNFVVDWGDGSNDTITVWNQAEVNHSYSSSGEYIVIMDGQIDGFAFNAGLSFDDNMDDGDKLIDVLNWGSLKISDGGEQFSNCENLVGFSATDILDVSGILNMNSIFRSSNSFIGTGLEYWNVTSVTDLTSAFYSLTNFNGNLNSWNVSSVDSFASTFRGATNFNKNLNSWDISSATDLRNMFRSATSFNLDISLWNPSSAQYMGYMFYQATNFNIDISSWNVSSVEYLDSTFREASSFNQDLSGWDVDQTTECTAFNGSTPAWVLPKPNFTSCTP